MCSGFISSVKIDLTNSVGVGFENKILDILILERKFEINSSNKNVGIDVF